MWITIAWQHFTAMRICHRDCFDRCVFLLQKKVWSTLISFSTTSKYVSISTNAHISRGEKRNSEVANKKSLKNSIWNMSHTQHYSLSERSTNLYTQSHTWCQKTTLTHTHWIVWGKLKEILRAVQTEWMSLP